MSFLFCVGDVVSEMGFLSLVMIGIWSGRGYIVVIFGYYMSSRNIVIIRMVWFVRMRLFITGFLGVK